MALLGVSGEPRAAADVIQLSGLEFSNGFTTCAMDIAVRGSSLFLLTAASSEPSEV